MKGDTTKRVMLFFGVCIPVRAGLAYAAYRVARASGEVARWAMHVLRAFVSLVILGWVRIMLFRPRDTGPETFGAPIWWKPHRLVHAAAYATFLYLSFAAPTSAWLPLALDAVFGAASGFTYHTTSPIYNKTG
jgi:hypothetical protein